MSYGYLRTTTFGGLYTDPKWRETVKAFLMRIENEVFEEPVAVKMALFLKSKSSEILKLVERAEKLAIAIQKQPLE